MELDSSGYCEVRGMARKGSEVLIGNGAAEAACHFRKREARYGKSHRRRLCFRSLVFAFVSDDIVALLSDGVAAKGRRLVASDSGARGLS
jgi:hypothetical protein